MKPMHYLSAALLVVSFSVLSIYAADVTLSDGWTPSMPPNAPGYSVQYVRMCGSTSQKFACAKIVGYNEFQIPDITTYPGQQVYATLLAALTSGTKVYICYDKASGYALGVGLSVN